MCGVKVWRVVGAKLPCGALTVEQCANISWLVCWLPAAAAQPRQQYWNLNSETALSPLPLWSPPPPPAWAGSCQYSSFSNCSPHLSCCHLQRSTQYSDSLPLGLFRCHRYDMRHPIVRQRWQLGSEVTGSVMTYFTPSHFRGWCRYVDKSQCAGLITCYLHQQLSH